MQRLDQSVTGKPEAAKRTERGRRRRRTMLLGGVMAAALTFSVSACSSSGGSSAPAGVSKKTITIYHIVSTTGPAAPYASTSIPVDKIAIAKINADGGINGLRIAEKTFDPALDPQEAVRLFQKLPRNIPVMMGPEFTTEAKAVAPLAAREKLPMIASFVSSDIDLARDNRPYVFLTTPDLAPVTDEAVKIFAQKQPGLKRAALLSDVADVAGTGPAKLLTKSLGRNGIKVTEKVGLQTGTSDFDPIAAKLKAAHPDVIVISTLATDAAGAVQAIRQQGVKVPILVSLAGFSSTSFTQNVHDLGEGIYGISTFYAGNPKVQGYVQAYRKQTGFNPQPVSGNLYESWMLLAAALRKAHIENKSASAARQAITKALASVSVTGIDGSPLSYNKGGYITQQGLLLQLGSGGAVTEVG